MKKSLARLPKYVQKLYELTEEPVLTGELENDILAATTIGATTTGKIENKIKRRGLNAKE